MKTLLYVAGLLWLVGCSRPAETPPSAGYEYFPLEVGQYRIFDVQETQYTLTAGRTTRSYQVQETTTQAFAGLDGLPAFRIERSSRTAPGQSWQLDSVWTARRTPMEAIRTENGVSFIRLLFPLRQGQSWDANRLNSIGPETHTLTALSEPVSLGGQTYDQTATVVQVAKASLVDSVSRKEIYARGVGLVYRESVELYYNNNQIGQNKIDFGKRYYQTLKSYGKQ